MTKLVHVSSKGEQVYTTPADFVDLCERRFGVNFVLDLAADKSNTRCEGFYDKKVNSLQQDWVKGVKMANFILPVTPDIVNLDPACWLNPEFKQATPFMRKCATEGQNGCKIIALTLSSLGTQWYKRWVKPYAMSYILEDRMIFEGQTAPYPKELMISLFGFGMTGLGWWNWKAAADVL